MDILRNHNPKLVIFDRSSKYGEALDLISMCNIIPDIFYYESEITIPPNQILKTRIKHPKLPTNENQHHYAQARKLIKDRLGNKNKKIVIQTESEYPPVNWFDDYNFFIATGTKRPANFLVNELRNLDEDITIERKETAEIMQSLLKLECCSTWLSWTKIFKDAGIKLGALGNLEIHNG